MQRNLALRNISDLEPVPAGIRALLLPPDRAAAHRDGPVVGAAPRAAGAVTRVVVVTNDFPPRSGGIQSFVHALAVRLPASSVVVYAPAGRAAPSSTPGRATGSVRHPTSLMLPTPDVARRAGALIRPGSTVVFGAAAPLGLLGGALRAAGAERVVMLTHGHEASWARLPLAGGLLRRIGDHADVVTYLGDYTRRRLAGRIPAGKLARLAPGSTPRCSGPARGASGCAPSSGWGSGPWWSACPAWSPGKGRTG